jgi:hypothetical protein
MTIHSKARPGRRRLAVILAAAFLPRSKARSTPPSSSAARISKPSCRTSPSSNGA